MPIASRLFNLIPKQKKALFLALLIFVVAGVLVPKHAFAISFTDIGNFILYAPQRIGAFIILTAISVPAMLLTWMFRMFADITYALLIYIINQMVRDPNNIWAITRANENGAGAVFLATWSIIKGYANMGIVLGFIGIAAATILRIREYEAKKLLPGLIIVALLVNFSIVFIGIMIDGSNLIMKSFAVGAEQEGDMILYVNRAHNNVVDPLYVRAIASAVGATNFADPIGAALTYAAAESIFFILYLVIAITFFLLSLVFIERYIMLAILFIVSPLAAVAWAFPFTRKHFGTWMAHFLKWLIAGLVASFFLRISVEVLSSPLLNNWNTNQGDSATVALPRIIMQLLVALGFVFAGYKASKKSAHFANVVLDTAKATAGIVIGATAAVATGGAAGALKIAGSTQAGKAVMDAKNQTMDWFKNRTNALRESVGLAPRGSAELEREASGKKATERFMDHFNSLAQTDEGKKILADKATKSTLGAERDAATRALNGVKGGLSYIGDKSAQRTALSQALSRGALSGTDIKRADHADLDDNAIKEELSKGNLVKKFTDEIDPATGRKRYTAEQAVAKANETALGLVRRRKYEAQDDSHIKKLAKEDLIALGKEDSDDGAMARERLAQEGLLDKDNMKMNDGEIGSLLNKDRSKYGSGVWKAAKKNNPLLSAFDEEVRNEIIKEKGEKGEGITETQLREEAIKKSVVKLTGDQLADLSPSVQKEIAKYASPQVLERAMVRASTKGKQAIAEGILADVENLPEKLKALTSGVSKAEIAELVNKSPKKAELRLRVGERAAASPVRKAAEQADVDRNRLENMEYLRKRGLMMTEAKRKQEEKNPLNLTPSLDKEYRDALAKLDAETGGFGLQELKLGEKIATTIKEREGHYSKMQSAGFKKIQEMIGALEAKGKKENKEDIDKLTELLKALR